MSEANGTNPPRGWYPDTNANYERWWNGTAWTDATHLNAALSGFGNPESRRKMWPGVNSSARVARTLGMITYGLPFVSMVILILTIFAPHLGLVIIFVVTGVDVLLAVLTLVFAIIGLVRSPQLGASSLAGLMIVFAVGAMFLDGVLVFVAVVISNSVSGS
ncbi:MAG: DUF2510 domain-containing protein [Lacisediminihabitans sp.]